jgi:S1-C subfamily serine protease
VDQTDSDHRAYLSRIVGGGLFDASGNLIGITTFMLRDTQALNFAIATEEFWH